MSKLPALLAVFALATLAPVASYAQQTTSTSASVLCVVKGEEIKDVAKAAGHANYNGKTYYFCCSGCVATFTKADNSGKARYAKLTSLRTERLLLTRKAESLAKEIRDTEKVDVAPKAAQAAKTGPVFCAVTGEEIASPALAAAKLSYNNKTYYLCCPGCKAKWEKNPAKYAAAADKHSAK